MESWYILHVSCSVTTLSDNILLGKKKVVSLADSYELI